MVIVLQPLMEARSSIVKVLHKMTSRDSHFTADSIQRVNRSGAKCSISRSSLEKTSPSPLNMTVLVAVDGSLHSLRALNHAIQIFDTTPGTKILVLNVIEWANDVEDSIDGELALKIEERDRKMLSSILLKDHIYKCERIVKLGDPASKIAEVVESN